MGFETCGPNEVLVVSGVGHSEPNYKIGGWVFVWPKLQKVQRLSLNLMTLSIETPDVITQQGISVSVKAVAQTKICAQNIEMLKMAAERFLGKSEEEISEIVKDTLLGVQKNVISKMDLEDIYFDNDKKFFKTMFEEGSTVLINMGILISSYKVVDVQDKKGQLERLMKERNKSNETTANTE